MASQPAKPPPARPSYGKRGAMAILNLLLAMAALWLGMSIPSYFRSVSGLVLEAAAAGTPTLLEQAGEQVESGRPALARTLLSASGTRP
ncbi:MAG: hypothetical protein ACP5I4_16025, partial [Oceanipulchritudo sp.]